MLATQENHIKCAKRLIYHGADVNFRSRDGWTCLDRAAHEVHTHLPTHARTHRHTHTHTHIYIYIYIDNLIYLQGLHKILEELLEHGGNPNVPAPDGMTALHRAVWNKHEECIRILLENDADPNIKDVCTWLYFSCFHITAFSGHCLFSCCGVYNNIVKMMMV